MQTRAPRAVTNSRKHFVGVYFRSKSSLSIFVMNATPRDVTNRTHDFVGINIYRGTLESFLVDPTPRAVKNSWNNFVGVYLEGKNFSGNLCDRLDPQGCWKEKDLFFRHLCVEKAVVGCSEIDAMPKAVKNNKNHFEGPFCCGKASLGIPVMDSTLRAVRNCRNYPFGSYKVVGNLSSSTRTSMRCPRLLHIVRII